MKDRSIKRGFICRFFKGKDERNVSFIEQFLSFKSNLRYDPREKKEENTSNKYFSI